MTTRTRAFFLAALAGAASTSAAAAPATQPAADWTTLAPGARQVYVSSSVGSDRGDGSAARPFKSLGFATRWVHDGDDLLLKRGDTFDESIGNHKWHNVTVATWGTGERPIVMPDTTNQSAALILNGGSVRFVGLHLVAAHRDPAKSDFKLVPGNYGIYIMNSDDCLIEDCLIEFFSNDVAVQGQSNKGFRLRRSVLRNAYSEGRGFSQGIFLDGQADPLIEDCVFDTCGWNPWLLAEAERRKAAGQPADQPAGTQPTTGPASKTPWLTALEPLKGQPFPGTPNMFNHGVYDHDSHGGGPSTVRNCIFVNCASSGMTQGVGGTVDDCLFVHNGMATDCWTGSDAGSITNCVALGSKECPSWAGGGGLTLISKSGNVAGNIVAHGAPPQHGAALVLWGPKGVQMPPDAKATFTRNIVFDWPAEGFYIPTTRAHVEFRQNGIWKTASRIVNITDGNDAEYLFEANAYGHSDQKYWLKNQKMDFDAFHQAVGSTTSRQMGEDEMGYPDPSRTIESYTASVGLPPTLHDFVHAAGLNTRNRWDKRFTADAVNSYIRAGFGLKPQH